MTLTKKYTNSNLKNDTKNIEKKAIKTWILRLLITMDGNAKFLNKHSFSSTEIAQYLNLEKFETEEYDQRTNFIKIRKMYNQTNKKSSGLPRNTILAKNIRKLAKLLSLNSTESAIIYLTIMIKTNPIMGEAIDLVDLKKPSLINKLYAGLLNIETNSVIKALNPDGVLSKTGLLFIDTEYYFDFDSRIKTLEGLVENIYSDDIDLIDMFKGSFRSASIAKLTKLDYPHIIEDVNNLDAYINSVHQNKKTGTNILLSGPPGVGKTEFVKMIANLTKSKLFEIGCQSVSGNPLKSSERFRAFRAAQNLLQTSQNNLILFDEIEDVFVQKDDDISERGNKSGMKAMVNKMLEDNPVPAFWITNNLRCIDKAYIRRFDYVIEITVPPKNVRERVLDHYLEGTSVSSNWKKQMSQYENLPPAVVERAASVLKSIQSLNPSIDADKSMHRMVSNTLEAMNYKRPLVNSEHISLDYKIDLLNADCNIDEVAKGIINNGQARICLYGPPGTGKSAFGRYIADNSGKRLMLKKASDLISPYLGESEQNMANMFREAQDQDAILMLDEADTYLQDRQSLSRSWEISSVNEMLTQIESFQGVFICSTNLMDSLDAAAMRRFDLKIKFDHLKKDQVWELFTNCANLLEINFDETIKPKLSSLSTLTPGDFATVLRQSRFRPVTDSWDLFDRLSAERAIKPESRKIGFH